MALLQALLKTLANIARKILQALLAVIRFILWLLKKSSSTSSGTPSSISSLTNPDIHTAERSKCM
jgi:hypothetical protein